MFKKIKRILGLVHELSHQEFETKFRKIIKNLNPDRISTRFRNSEKASINYFYLLREIVSQVENDEEIMLYVENTIINESSDFKRILSKVMNEYMDLIGEDKTFHGREDVPNQLESDLRGQAVYLVKFRTGHDDQ